MGTGCLTGWLGKKKRVGLSILSCLHLPWSRMEAGGPMRQAHCFLSLSLIRNTAITKCRANFWRTIELLNTLDNSEIFPGKMWVNVQYLKNLVQSGTHGTESDWRQITQLLARNEIMFTENLQNPTPTLVHVFSYFCLQRDCVALGSGSRFFY